MAKEVDEYLNLILSQEHVFAVLILNSEGLPVKSTLDYEKSLDYAGLITSLIDKGNIIFQYSDPLDHVINLRMRTKKTEIMAFTNGEFTVIMEQFLFK